MGPKCLLVVTALAEGGAGILLVAAPSVVLALLFGVTSPAPEALVLGRVTGGALLALAIACWAGRDDDGRAGRRGLLTSALTYDGIAAVALAVAGLVDGLVGIALWPAVAVHTTLAGWCVLCLIPSSDPPGPFELRKSVSD